MPQRIYTNKDMSSPTISIEAMMLSCPIDAKKNRYIMVSDITGAFLHADMEYNVHMLLEGTVAEMIIKLDPTIYRKQIRSGIQHSGSLLTRRHGRHSVHATGRNGCRNDHKIRPNNIQKTHMVQQTWQAYVICTTKEGLYGTLQAALLFWRLLSETLQEWGFTLNPYDKV